GAGEGGEPVIEDGLVGEQLVVEAGPEPVAGDDVLHDADLARLVVADDVHPAEAVDRGGGVEERDEDDQHSAFHTWRLQHSASHTWRLEYSASQTWRLELSAGSQSRPARPSGRPSRRRRRSPVRRAARDAPRRSAPRRPRARPRSRPRPSRPPGSVP